MDYGRGTQGGSLLRRWTTPRVRQPPFLEGLPGLGVQVWDGIAQRDLLKKRPYASVGSSSAGSNGTAWLSPSTALPPRSVSGGGLSMSVRKTSSAPLTISSGLMRLDSRKY
jgi:hypothetical protein